MFARNRLIVALDVSSASNALALAEQLQHDAGLFKIGLELFYATGPTIVTQLREICPNVGIFLDLKLHDIPNTMRGALRTLSNLGVEFITVHTAAGPSHLSACVDAADGRTRILGVTVLTSQDEASCRATGLAEGPKALVHRRAQLAAQAGCAGIVCSGQELADVRRIEPELITVVPGIRPSGAEIGDQKRVMTPKDAIAAGASYLVVGRPITQAPNPRLAAQQIVAEIEDGLERC